ncbi:maturase K [Striga asiatica]|uniref:Maturase K n=1 Tax=Striga asiatica TaxID=4170 RepID=A0A5A7P081_STRAF|nr:maturase K [Striga asiatica]
MSNPNPAVGSRFRGNSLGLPSVSRYRVAHMPSSSGIFETLSESDMDTSDSEGDRYGTRYSPEASPQDDKIPNGVSRHSAAGPNAYSSDASNNQGTYLERLRGGQVAPSAARRDYAYDDDDDSADSVTSSEVNSTPPRGNNDILPERRNYNPEADSSSASRGQQIKFSNDDIPSAPPLAGSFQNLSEISGKSATDVTARLTKSEGSADGIEANKCRSSKSEVEACEMSARKKGSSSNSLPARYPTFHASGLGYWYSVLSYDACVRLCLHSWAKGCMEAPPFLESECALLREAFGLKHVLLQSEEELMKKDSSDLVGEGAYVKSKKTIGKIKVQVRKVRMGVEPPTGCSFTSIKSSSMVKLESLQLRLSNMKSIVTAERKALRRDRIIPVMTVNGSLLPQKMAYIIVGTRRYLKEVPELIKIGFSAWRSTSASSEVVQESYSCLLRLKSSPEEDAARMQPGSGESRLFLPDGFGDDLIIEVHDSKGKYCGQALVQVADIADESGEKLRHCLIYREPDHEQIGKIQLSISYSTTHDENNYKCASVAETIAYDCVLETAMKVQEFQQRNLLLHGAWKWLVTEFASYFGVSDAYTKLRYLSYVMDVATPTADCLDLVHDLLQPVIIKGKNKQSLSHQEVRLLGEVSEQIEQILTLVFENYKSLDESAPSGIVDVFGPATGEAAPALAPALKLYKLLYDILSPEVQLKLCRYFQNATRKRSRRHLSETDEFVSNNNENMLLDPVALSTAYKKMKSLCLNIRNEILTDIEIHKQDLLPSFMDLPNLSSSIYSTELYSRLRAFLVSCPPAGPSPPVVELVMATADFQRDLSLWDVSYIKGGVDAKELFHVYITLWIQDKRLGLLELCKPDRVKSAGFASQHSTTPFIDDIYDRLKETLLEYDVIISRWPEYTFALENAISDVEKAVVESLEKQYAETLSPLKESTMPMKFGLKYMQKFAKGNPSPYNVSTELGIVLNSMKRMLDILRPQIESKLKQWGYSMPETGNMVPGERLSEVTVMIRSKFRAYVQAVIEKLVGNTKLHNITKLKKIIQDAKDNVIESELRRRMQPLKELLGSTIDQLHGVFESQVFLIVCRSFWDRMGQDVLKFLEDRKENRSLYKASRIAVTVLDDTFASQMQQLLGNALQETDLEPPRCIMEVRSMLCKDVTNKTNNYYY